LREDEIRAALIARHGVEEERAALVARLANGSYTRALALLEDDLIERRREVVSFIRFALASSAVQIAAAIDALAELRNRDAVIQFLVLMLMWFRDALVLARGGTIINLDQQDDVRRFLERFPGADMLQVLAEVEKTISLVERNVYIKLALLRLAVMLRAHILPGAAGPKTAGGRQ
jgi:DNA polymerase-3 subunit delta'